MSVVSLAEFKHFLQIDESDTSQDTLFQSLIDSAESKVSNYLGGLASASYTEKHDFKQDMIILPYHYPIISVASLKITGQALTEDTDFFVYPFYIRLYYYTASLLMPVYWAKAVEITYTAGYDTVPEDIKMAIKLTAANYVKLNTELKPEQAIDYRMPQEAKDLLFPYRRPEI
jgi:hypothetical protein